MEQKSKQKYYGNERSRSNIMSNPVKPFHLAFEKELDYLKDIEGVNSYVYSLNTFNKWINLFDIEEIYDPTFHIMRYSGETSFARISYRKYGHDRTVDFQINFDTLEDEGLNSRVQRDVTELVSEFYKSFFEAWTSRGEKDEK